MASTIYRVKTVAGHKYVYKVEETCLGRIEKVDPAILEKLQKGKRRGTINENR